MSLSFSSWFQQGDRYYNESKHSSSTSSSNNVVFDSTECYACTQVGVPVFHSTSCDSAHQPEWQALAGSSLVPIHAGSNPISMKPTRCQTPSTKGPFGSILDPRSKWVQKWNRVSLLTRGIALAIDPLFFYALSLSIGKGGAPCLYVNIGFAAIVTIARSCVDALHSMASMAAIQAGVRVEGVPCFWVREARVERTSHCFSLREVTERILVRCFCYHANSPGNILVAAIAWLEECVKVTGYIFGTIWWGFGLNLVAYLIASHVTGGCWYVLATERVATCLQKQCERNGNCNLTLQCSTNVCYRFMYPADKYGNPCGRNSTWIAKPLCLDDNGPFNYGIYSPALLVVSSNSLAVKILYPIFWGLLNLSSFGNELAPTSNLLEVMFSIYIVLCGFGLFTLLIGNIQVFLHVVMAKNKKMQLRRRDVEWWMRRRQLPTGLRQRFRHFERQKWRVMGGEDEMRWIEELPEGLRRDIKRYLCLDLIKKVPLFHNLDDLILDNICDRVRLLVYSKDEKTASRPPPQLLFVWNRRKRFVLDAYDLRYITDHFRYRFASKRLRRTMRYYSSNWRTWAAVNIQFAWRRYRIRRRGRAIPDVVNGSMDNRLLQYAAMFMSLRPHDHFQ
ncbi:hypothetical protein OIU77_001725 [Salix suchowensis]|uniref:Uncharacterized protein n=1 Tax=Salix suchowensis TaxID=1278906 RepID=A0ABQ9B4B2_9ROSI|nr:hypothetical protein OIU77_001725 [Salix suchowensis]